MNIYPVSKVPSILSYNTIIISILTSIMYTKCTCSRILFTMEWIVTSEKIIILTRKSNIIQKLHWQSNLQFTMHNILFLPGESVGLSVAATSSKSTVSCGLEYASARLSFSMGTYSAEAAAARTLSCKAVGTCNRHADLFISSLFSLFLNLPERTSTGKEAKNGSRFGRVVFREPNRAKLGMAKRGGPVN